ncbi:hypothetical protein [Arthrobacter sp. 2MCAF14]
MANVVHRADFLEAGQDRILRGNALRFLGKESLVVRHRRICSPNVPAPA